jgi:hypothetical protein
VVTHALELTEFAQSDHVSLPAVPEVSEPQCAVPPLGIVAEQLAPASELEPELAPELVPEPIPELVPELDPDILPELDADPIPELVPPLELPPELLEPPPELPPDPELLEPAPELLLAPVPPLLLALPPESAPPRLELVPDPDGPLEEPPTPELGPELLFDAEPEPLPIPELEALPPSLASS